MSKPAPKEEVAVLQTTAGTIVLRFYEDLAPKHVESFKKLSRDDYYDGIKFHRVIKGFMIQGGCPNTKDKPPYDWGRGGPGYTVDAEFSDTPHVKGTVSMARTSDPNSAGSQFFICHGRAAHLDGQYTVFGQAIEGLDVVDLIAESEVIGDRPIEPTTIENVEIIPWEEWETRNKD